MPTAEIFLSLAFYLFAALVLGSATVVVFAKNLVHSAYCLLLTLFGVAGLYVLMGADLLAAAQILIYVGGILVLILFGVMLTNRIFGATIRTGIYQLVPGLIAFFALGCTLMYVLLGARWANPAIVDVTTFQPTTQEIGTSFLTQFLLPFEVASVLLLAALIAAAMLVRPEEEEASS